jgi:hypothetical protein
MRVFSRICYRKLSRFDFYFVLKGQRDLKERIFVKRTFRGGCVHTTGYFTTKECKWGMDGGVRGILWVSRYKTTLILFF